MKRMQLGHEVRAGAPTDGSILELVHALCVELLLNPDSGATRSAAKDTLLDVRVGELRCVVLRCSSVACEDIVAASPRERQIAALVARGYHEAP
jgi:hypothetical protein